MKLHELADEPKNQGDEDKGVDACLLMARINQVEGPEKIGFPFSDKRRGAQRHVILVENEETGLAEYMFMYPDGHLGAVED